jgi:hypothetical protein
MSIEVLNADDGMTIEQHKALWMECEESKMAPRLVLKGIAQKQRPSTKALRAYMEDHELDVIDIGAGWSIQYECGDKVVFNEAVCESYMDSSTMERFKQEQRKRKVTFKTITPAKKARVDDDQ